MTHDAAHPATRTNSRETVPFCEFFRALIAALEQQRVRSCILRNYEGFPECNVGSDIDFLIFPSDLPRAMDAVRSIHGVELTELVKRHAVASLYLKGISRETNLRPLEIDFDLNLAWKGLPFLSTEAVFQKAMPAPCTGPAFLVPCPVHEAIISLLTSFLIAGQIKEKYRFKVQQTFAAHRAETIEALQTQFGSRMAARLVDATIGNDSRTMQKCLLPLRGSLVMLSLCHGPARTLMRAFRHYAGESKARFSLWKRRDRDRFERSSESSGN